MMLYKEESKGRGGLRRYLQDGPRAVRDLSRARRELKESA